MLNSTDGLKYQNELEAVVGGLDVSFSFALL